MCGRFTLFSDYDYLVERFEIESAFDEASYYASYNIAPSQQVVSIINDGMKNRMGHLKWGFIPSWAKDEKIGYKMINARAETLADKPAFKNAFKQRRCLIIADAFYEWKSDSNTKTPMLIKMKDNQPFAMAGLWERWHSPNGKILYTCTIITTSSNELMKPFHDRMPAILKQNDEKIWLNRAINDTEQLQSLLTPYDDTFMEAYEVSSDVNSPKYNDPHLIKRLR